MRGARDARVANAHGAPTAFVMTFIDFYSAEARRDSQERVFGEDWKLGSRAGSYKLVWLEATGELVLMRSSNPLVGNALPLPYGATTVAPANTMDEVLPVADFDDSESLNIALDAWELGHQLRDATPWISERFPLADL